MSKMEVGNFPDPGITTTTVCEEEGMKAQLRRKKEKLKIFIENLFVAAVF